MGAVGGGVVVVLEGSPNLGVVLSERKVLDETVVPPSRAGCFGLGRWRFLHQEPLLPQFREIIEIIVVPSGAPYFCCKDSCGPGIFQCREPQCAPGCQHGRRVPIGAVPRGVRM